MASTDSTATSGKIFAPPIWKPNQARSQEQNVASFRVYAMSMTMKMDSHLKLLEQGMSKAESTKEKGEPSNKRKRGIVREDCGEWPVITVESDSDEDKKKSKKGDETKDQGVESKGKAETKEDVKKEAAETEEGGEESEEDGDESEEDEETDKDGESDADSDSKSERMEKLVADPEDADTESKSNDDGDSGSAFDYGNCVEGDHEISEDSSMFRMKIPD